MTTEFYNKTIEQSLLELKSEVNNGLTTAEAAQRLEQNGPNRLKSAKRKSMFLRILEQFKDFLVIMLVIAAIISAVVVRDPKDALIIVAILVVNMIIGITQENKADNALKELKNMASPKAKVRRDGQTEKIDSDRVVTGDIVILEAGDYIPADVRIIESINLKIDEASLTGESVPVDKNAHAVLDSETGLGDRVNLASMGTVVTYGRGVGVVFATGMDTEMGKIATILSETDEASTPLQEKLNDMAKTLGIACIIICSLVFVVGFLYNFLKIGEHREIIEMFMVSVALAVAAVPEGIAIVATVILAIGVRKMVKSNAIVKKLRAVETLGSTTVICSDKTGTLTQNKMTVTEFFGDERLLAESMFFCNDVQTGADGTLLGDPTQLAQKKFGLKYRNFTDRPRLGEIPFDSKRKMMTTLHAPDAESGTGEKCCQYTTGAPDEILNRCDTILTDGSIQPLTQELRDRVLAENTRMAEKALRVLCGAFRKHDSFPGEISPETIETKMTFAGLVGMIDPPRDEVRGAVEHCHSAGITVKMITGDHKITASAIAQTLGIMKAGDAALDGNDLNNMSDEELREKVKTINVFARVSPENKVRIVTAVKENGNIVAMTGDGVNDAPSLKKADIGIAMGITGTDVSKEAADMILTDDNFVSIVHAVEQGRTIYGNIRKVTGYLLACNIGEILIILLAIIFGLPVPLVATQLLFVNLLTDAFPAFALGMEGQEPGVMKKRPRDPKEPIINKGMKGSVVFRSIFVCIGALGAFLLGLNLFNYEIAMSMCFFTLVASELFVVYPSKSETFTGFKRSFMGNKFLNISMWLSFAALVIVMYVPILNDMFSTAPLSFSQLGMCIALVMVPILGSELSKKLFVISK
ncbi:MAG: cation-translocating P-type ATPase [Treponema sp.]|nr:cation-translocating P-type ATPase [Treponema sp.]